MGGKNEICTMGVFPRGKKIYSIDFKVKFFLKKPNFYFNTRLRAEHVRLGYVDLKAIFLKYNLANP